MFIIQLGYCRCLTGDVVCGLPRPHNIFMVPVWNTISNASSRVSRVYENKCENDQWPARAEQPPPRPEGDKYYIFSRIKQRPAPPRPGGIQSDYFPIFGSIGKPDFLPPFFQQSLAGLIMFVDTGKFFCYAIISRIGMWWERGFKLAFKPGHFKTFNAPLGVSMDIDKLCKNCCKHWAHIL